MPSIQHTIIPANYPAYYNTWTLTTTHTQRWHQVHHSINHRYRFTQLINQWLRIAVIKREYQKLYPHNKL